MVEGRPLISTDPSKPLGLPPPWQLLQLPSNGAPVRPVGGFPLLANQTSKPSKRPVIGSNRELRIECIKISCFNCYCRNLKIIAQMYYPVPTVRASVIPSGLFIFDESKKKNRFDGEK